MIDRAIKQIQGSNLDYRTSDFKAEIHFFGQIVGASNIQHDEGLFVEAFFEHGEKWKCLSPNNPLQTQTGYMNVLVLFVS